LVPSADAKEAIDLFAATLAFSNLTNEEGFDELDFDNDGKPKTPHPKYSNSAFQFEHPHLQIHEP
jgi:hypothetical protein